MEKSAPKTQLETKDPTAVNELSAVAASVEATGNVPATNAPQISPPLTPRSQSGDNQKGEPNDSANEPAGTTTPRNAEEFFSMQQRFPLQVFEQLSSGQKLSHWGPTVTSIASLVLTLFVWNNTAQLSKQQLDLQERQVQADLSEIRFKFLNDLTSDDEDKKIPAEISLAGHGSEALPVVYFALGVEQQHIRQSAVKVFRRMFEASSSFSERDELLTTMMGRMMSPNKTLRTGIVQSLVEVGSQMNSSERKRVTTFLEDKVPPQNVCREAEGRNMVKEAAKFFGASDANSVSYLTAIAGNPECGDGWAQAMVKLGELAKQPQRRNELLATLEQTKNAALSNLRERISDEDLTVGFGDFLKGRNFEVKFADVQERVEQEFERLRKNLAEQER